MRARPRSTTSTVTSTGSIIADTSNVNRNNAGFYTVTYNVTDAAGNAATEVTRTVEVVAVPGSLPVNPWLIAAAISSGEHPRPLAHTPQAGPLTNSSRQSCRTTRQLWPFYDRAQ